MTKPEDIAFIIPVKDGMSHTLYLKDGTIVVIDVRTGDVQQVSRLPSHEDIAEFERAAHAARTDLEHRLPRLPIREIDHADRRGTAPVDSQRLPTGVDRRS